MAIGDWTDNELREFVRGVLRQAPEATLLRSMGTMVLSGAGDPEGRVAAAVGALFLRRDGGAGTSLYVKESGGSDATGWVAK